MTVLEKLAVYHISIFNAKIIRILIILLNMLALFKGNLILNTTIHKDKNKGNVNVSAKRKLGNFYKSLKVDSIKWKTELTKYKLKTNSWERNKLKFVMKPKRIRLSSKWL